MGAVVVYQEQKMSLAPKEFLLDVLSHKQIIEMPDYEAIKQIALFAAFQVEAFKISNEMTPFDKKEIKELILSHFKRLSMNELYYAFKLERYGQYDEATSSYGRFDALFVSQVLNKYKKWKMNQRVKHNLPIGKKVEANTISEDEKKAMILKGVMQCYDAYKESYLIPDGKTYVYDVLYDIDLLPKDPNSKFEAYSEAKNVIKMNLYERPSMSLKDRDEYKYIKAQLELEQSDLVIRQAKHILIGRYFRKTKRTELESILNKRL